MSKRSDGPKPFAQLDLFISSDPPALSASKALMVDHLPTSTARDEFGIPMWTSNAAGTATMLPVGKLVVTTTMRSDGRLQGQVYFRGRYRTTLNGPDLETLQQGALHLVPQVVEADGKRDLEFADWLRGKGYGVK